MGRKECRTHRFYGHAQMVYRISAHIPLAGTQSLVPTLTIRDAKNLMFLCAQEENEQVWGTHSTVRAIVSLFGCVAGGQVAEN